MYFKPFLLLFAFFPSLLFGQTYELERGNGVVNIGGNCSIYEDKTAGLELMDILKQNIQDEFKSAESDIPLFNVTASTIWMKISLTTNENEEWYFYWGCPNAQVVELYKISEGKITSIKAGILRPYEERSMIGNNVMFPLRLKKGESADFYLKINDIAPLRGLVKVGTQSDLADWTFTKVFWQGSFLGIMILMVLYNLFLYLTNRNRVYLYYIIYVLSNTIFISFFCGYVNLMPDFVVDIFIYLPVVFPAGLGVFGMLFTMDFLDTKKNAPKMHKFLFWLCFTVTIPFILCFIGDPRNGILTIQVLGLVVALASIYTGNKVLRTGYRPARYYVLGFGIYMSSLMLLILNDFIGLSNEFLSQDALLVGSVIEAIMLSFAIGDKLNSANRDKHIAQKQALVSAQENEKLIREQNAELERKVKERTAEVVLQKEIIEEKQKEIVDSINYAKRIQYSLLAHSEMLNANLNEHFVFFKPKDIVSGDFYWCTKKGDDFYLAVCDSTGHGVPGAFMSLLNISFLNEAINEKNISEPHSVLNHVRERLIQNMENAQDGMDAILMKFEVGSSKSEVKYAAANNHPVLIRNNEIKELPFDKMPVGKGLKNDSFELYRIEIQKGDSLYLFTDGYADQFGGPKGKKYKYSNLQKLLLENSGLQLETQNSKLETIFNDWKGGLEQIDDVCVIGIKL